MPARLGSWSLRAALPSVATAETPPSSPAAAASTAASSVLEIASERPQDARARHSVRGLPVVKIHIVTQYLADQGTSISLDTFGSSPAEPREPDVLSPPPAKSQLRRFANLHRYPVHLHPGLFDAAIVRLNNAERVAKPRASPIFNASQASEFNPERSTRKA